ncbi:MAG: hypothetical protein QM715_20195 [Nibricoccus sp.]
MKSISALLVLAFSTTVAYAQNSFPASGSVSIGGSATHLSFSSATNVERLILFGDGGGVNDYGFGIDATDLVANFGPGGGITFKTSGILGAPLMRITGSGNVGIGTTSPTDKFEVFGNQKVHVSTDQNIRLASYTDAGLAVYNDNNTALMPLRLYGAPLLLNPAGGNIGIGTIGPSLPLDIVTDRPYGVRLYRTLSTSGMLLGADNAGAVFCTEGVHAFRFYTNSEERFQINSVGNVGIGTTSPSEKLSVNGKIRAKEVIVETTGWSDHVFADSYKLQTLSEVEQHIKTEKHLPGVPSAQEVAEKGVSVGDMQAILLAKIEELTLHQIAQEKELKAQRVEINALKVENAQLKAPIKSSISAN